MLIPQDAIHAEKVFHIHGWSEAPLVRKGLNWIGYSRQSKTFLKIAMDMQVGEKRTLPFRTIAGEVKYQLERVR